MPDQRISRPMRRLVEERAGGCCEYCRSQARYATGGFSIEHIVPRDLGGATDPANLALCCQGCNNHKYIKVEAEDPSTRRLAPLFHPRRDRWSDHFLWSEDFTEVLGLTPTGRATVAALRLNRPGLVNLRRELHATGKHPPPAPEDAREGLGP